MISIRDFSGLRLNADPTDIPDNASQHCADVDFSRLVLQGLSSHVEATAAMPTLIRGALIHSDTAGAERIYVWPYMVHAVQSMVQQDAYKRFYWTGKNMAGNQEFKFGLVGENTGNAVVAPYKVGVINSTLWDNAPESLGISFDTAPAGPSVSFSELSSHALKLWLCDANGGLIKDVSSTVASLTPQGTPVNGWSRSYRIVTNTTLAEHAEKTVATVTYSKVSADLSLGGSTLATGDVWYAAGVAKYLTLSAASPAMASMVGQQVRVQIVATIGHAGIGDGYEAQMQYTELGSFYVTSGSSLSVDNSATPTSLTVAVSGETTLPEGYAFAVAWDVQYGDQNFNVVFYLDREMSGSLDLGTGVTGALTKIDEYTYDLNLTFGAQLGYETRAYILTVVNNLREESEPSYPVEMTLRPGSENVRIRVDTTALLAGINASALVANRYPVHGFRVYRSVGGDFFYVGTLKGSSVVGIGGENYLPYSIDGSDMLFIDDVSGAALGDACSTVDYISNAEDLQKLSGLCAVYNGIMAAFVDNEVWLSEPYMPWAWKRRNVVSLPHRILAIIPYEQGLLAMTELKTYYMAGQQPSDFMPSALAGDYPCIGSRAVASINGDVLYLSTDGPVIVSGASQRLDQTVVSRDGWRDLMADVLAGGSEVRLVPFGSRLLMYWGSSWPMAGGGSSWGILFNVESGQWSHVTTPMSFAMHVPAGSFSLASDALAFSYSDKKFWLFAAQPDTRQLWAWQSKDFVVPAPTNYPAMQLFGSGTVRITVRADGSVVSTQDVVASEAGSIVRLPSGFRAARWSFGFAGLTDDAKLRRVHVGSITEFANVV